MSAPEPEIDAAKDIQMWLEDCVLNRPMTAQEVCHLGIKCRFWQLTILRDYFAAAALQAILAGTGKEFMVQAAKSVDDASRIMGELVAVCYGMADAMIKAREK